MESLHEMSLVFNGENLELVVLEKVANLLILEIDDAAEAE